MSDLQYWLALNSLIGIGPVAARGLLSEFGSPEKVLQAPEAELLKVDGIGRQRVKNITSFNQWDDVRKTIDAAGENNIHIITLNDSVYPDSLRRLHDAPLVLYVKGELKEMDKYAVAIVGSRTCSAYGMQVAEKMGGKLASSGLTVVSGMARGIDTASHKGALIAGGRTIAVMGSGIDVPYPASNKGLMRAISASGAVISEFPFGTPPNRENFPRRNRLISALSYGVVVIEAALDSGSLITVGYALEQGREVFAVPGNITSRNSQGTNDLIKKGAKLVETAEEVLEELGPQLKGVLREDKLAAGKELPALTDDEAVLCKFLSTEPRHVDVITREAGLTSGLVLSALLSLELKGVVSQAQGKCFYMN